MKKIAKIILIVILLIALIVINNTISLRLVSLFTRTDNVIINVLVANLLDLVGIIFIIAILTKKR